MARKKDRLKPYFIFISAFVTLCLSHGVARKYVSRDYCPFSAKSQDSPRQSDSNDLGSLINPIS